MYGDIIVPLLDHSHTALLYTDQLSLFFYMNWIDHVKANRHVIPYREMVLEETTATVYSRNYLAA